MRHTITTKAGRPGSHRRRKQNFKPEGQRGVLCPQKNSLSARRANKHTQQDIKAQNSVISAQNDTITELRNHIKAQNDINAQLRNDIKAQNSVISAQNEKIALLENNVDTLINANILRACQQAKAQEEEEEQEEEQGDTPKDKGKKRQRE